MKALRWRVLAQAKVLVDRMAQAGAGSPGARKCACRSLSLHMRMVLALVATFAAGARAGNALAETANHAGGQVTVGATVLRHISVRVLTAPLTISVSEADIVRGYVDLPLASTLEIRSNSPAGCLLAFQTQADFSTGTEVRGIGGVALLGRTGGVLSVPSGGSGMRTTAVALSFRVLLSQQARPGVHPWPIQISVLPI